MTGQPCATSSPRAIARRLARRWLAPAVAAGGAASLWIVGCHGPDMPAQVYGVALFRHYGFVLWDTGWYGGHYQASYSVLAPVLGALLGIYGAFVVTAAIAAWAFDRLVEPVLGNRARAVTLLFSVGTVVPVAIGQLPFLSGEALGLVALLAARRRRPVLAVLAALTCALLSEVAAAFLVLVLVAWAVTRPRSARSRLLALAAVTALPVVAFALLLPGLGPFPFLGPDLAVVLAVCAVGVAVLPARYHAVRIGLVLYALTAIVVFLVPNPLGGNVGRLAEDFAPPLALAFASVPRRRAFALLAVPLLVWQWVPAVAAVAPAAGDPSAHASYYAPLIRYLTGQAVIGRVEIPFTRDHWEAAYVAPHVPMARGWERQLDTVDNPIFYQAAPLTSREYHAWLDRSSVTWIALPDTAFDYSARAEVHVIASAPSYLRPVWHDAHWKVWRVVGSPGLVSGPATLVRFGATGFAVDARRPGVVTVRVRYTRLWQVTSGDACIQEPGSSVWTKVVVHRPGRVTVGTSLLGSSQDCDAGP